MQWICSHCGAGVTPSADMWRCPRCAGPFELLIDRSFDRSMIDASRPGLWRYAHALPIDAGRAVSFHEPMTPIVPLVIDGVAVSVKLDGMLPTGSYKDRGISVLVSWLVEQGIARVVEDSSGNAAASVAGYAARAGIECDVYAPAHASQGKLVQAAAYGAHVHPIPGNRDDVAHAAEVAAEQAGYAYASHNWHPLFVEGVKSWALELWEQRGFSLPDVVVVPAGSGSLVLGAFHAFKELLGSGEITDMPRIFAAQSEACAPLVTALTSGATETTPFNRTPSIAEGIMIANPVRGRSLLAALRESNGGATASAEHDIKRALVDAARQGVYVEPTSATAIASYRTLLETGVIGRDDDVVVLMSGHGLKATSVIGEVLVS